MKNQKPPIKVIGWTDYDDWYFPACEEVTDEVVDAIVDALIEGEYIFGGDAHQNRWDCCPVLSDGTRVAVSTRSWGGIMSMAYNKMHKGAKTNYMTFYMDEFIMVSARKYPPARVDESLITATKTVHEIHYTHEVDEFDDVSRDIWIAPKTAEYETYKQGDYIDFFLMDGCPHFTRKIVYIVTAPSFEQILPEAMFGVYDNSESFGLKPHLSKEEILQELYKEFPREEVEKHGAIAFILQYLRSDYK